MPLADVLEPFRPTLDEVVALVHVSQREQADDVRGSLAENLTGAWLDRCPSVSFDTDVPRRANGWYLNTTGRNQWGGVIVRSRHADGKPITEYDFLIFFEGVPYIVEAKARKVRPQPNNRRYSFAEKLLRKRDVACHVYGREDIGIALFIPFFTFGCERRERLQQAVSGLECVDLGYKPKHLARATQTWYSYQTGSGR